MIQKISKFKIINAIYEFIRGVHSEGTSESAKRTYGGLLIVAYIAMTCFGYTNIEEMLYSGCILIAGGTVENLYRKKFASK